jgi:hypothetical protein
MHMGTHRTRLLAGLAASAVLLSGLSASPAIAMADTATKPQQQTQAQAKKQTKDQEPTPAPSDAGPSPSPSGDATPPAASASLADLIAQAHDTLEHKTDDYTKATLDCFGSIVFCGFGQVVFSGLGVGHADHSRAVPW